MMRISPAGQRIAAAFVLASLAGLGVQGAASAAGPGRADLDRPKVHAFAITYRNWGPVKAESAFRPANGYAARFEGCFAKRSEEAICAFTVRADHSVTITNIDNLSHGSSAGGADLRTCCLFVQGDDKGYPILKGAGVATFSRRLEPGQELGLMLRVPDYGKAQPLTAITFSRGEQDLGVTFPARVQEMP